MSQPEAECPPSIPWWKSNVIRGVLLSLGGLITAFVAYPGTVTEFLADDQTQMKIGGLIAAVGAALTFYGRVTACPPIKGTAEAKKVEQTPEAQP